jgi:ubiquinone/menaquinone biosynthesis C-methylase UbiE
MPALLLPVDCFFLAADCACDQFQPVICREGTRPALMSELLDPMHRRYLQSLDVVKSGATTLEVGCGNGSISAWLAQQVAPDGRAVAVDPDLSLVDVHSPNLELRKADIMAGAVEPGNFDVVTARAALHHVADAEKAIANLVASLRPGGAILLIETDFLPVTIAEPSEVHAFWSAWLAWSRDQGIDYQIGRTLVPRLAALVSNKSVALRKPQCTTGPVCGQIIGYRRSQNFART